MYAYAASMPSCAAFPIPDGVTACLKGIVLRRCFLFCATPTRDASRGQSTQQRRGCPRAQRCGRTMLRTGSRMLPLLLCTALPRAATSAAPTAACSMAVSRQVLYRGDAFLIDPESTAPEDCCAACAAHENCTAWVLQSNSATSPPTCRLKAATSRSPAPCPLCPYAGLAPAPPPPTCPPQRRKPPTPSPTPPAGATARGANPHVLVFLQVRPLAGASHVPLPYRRLLKPSCPCVCRRRTIWDTTMSRSTATS